MFVGCMGLLSPMVKTQGSLQGGIASQSIVSKQKSEVLGISCIALATSGKVSVTNERVLETSFSIMQILLIFGLSDLITSTLQTSSVA